MALKFLYPRFRPLNPTANPFPQSSKCSKSSKCRSFLLLLSHILFHFASSCLVILACSILYYSKLFLLHQSKLYLVSSPHPIHTYFSSPFIFSSFICSTFPDHHNAYLSPNPAEQHMFLLFS